MTVTESEWRGEGLDEFELRKKVDAFKTALHDLTREAIADLPEIYVIDFLKDETNHLQLRRYFPKKESVGGDSKEVK